MSASACGAAPSASALDRGAQIYAEKCVIRHQPTGQGVPPVYLPLAGSDWLKADRARAAKVLCEGLSGPITVNGQSFVNTMGDGKQVCALAQNGGVYALDFSSGALALIAKPAHDMEGVGFDVLSMHLERGGDSSGRIVELAPAP